MGKGTLGGRSSEDLVFGIHLATDSYFAIVSKTSPVPILTFMKIASRFPLQ